MKSYQSKNGKYQKMYDKYKSLVPKQGEADSEHIELLRIVVNIYQRFYKDGDSTWYSIIRWGHMDEDYRPPKDAPDVVKKFFMYAKEEYRAYEEQYRKYDHGDDEFIDEDGNFEPNVVRFSEKDLEDVVDNVILYVDQKELEVKKKPASKKKAQEKPKPAVAPGECKILNPASGKYVNLHGPTAMKILKKYMPELFEKK